MLAFWFALVGSIGIILIDATAVVLMYMGRVHLRTNGTLVALLMGVLGVSQMWGNAFPVLAELGVVASDRWLALVPLSIATKTWVLIATWRLLHVARVTNRYFLTWNSKRSGLAVSALGAVLFIFTSTWIADPSDMGIELFRGTYLVVAYAVPVGLAVFVSLTGSNGNKEMRDVVFLAALVTVVAHFALFAASITVLIGTLAVLHILVALRLLLPGILERPSRITMDTPNVWDIYFTSVLELKNVEPALEYFIQSSCTETQVKKWEEAKDWLKTKRSAAASPVVRQARDRFRQHADVDSYYTAQSPEEAVSGELLVFDRQHSDQLFDWTMQTRLHESIRARILRDSNDSGLLCNAATESDSADSGFELDEDWTPDSTRDDKLDGLKCLDEEEIVYASLNEFEEQRE